MRSRSAPRRSIAAIVASITPVNAPRQPACAAPIDARLRVGEQDRPAIGGRYADREPGVAVTTASARGRASGAQGCSDRHHLRRMDLIGGEEAIRRDAERCRHAGAVLRHVRGRIVGAGAAVEACVDAVGDAARAGEEGVADAGQRGQR